MSVKIFDDILRKGLRENKVPLKNAASINWYRNAGKELRGINENKLMNADKNRLVSRPEVGECYIFRYDPKYKDTLPYYDECPLIFPFSIEKDSFLALNLHYINPQDRAKLMNLLYTTKNNENLNNQTKLILSYKILQGLSQTKYYRPCVKRYLYSHLQSKFMEIRPREWDMILWMSVAKWKKRTGNYIYSQSSKKY